MACKLVIFDFDGTLYNSIGGLMFSMNKVLEHFELPIHTAVQYTSFVGHGIKNLVHHALPEDYRDELLESGYEMMMKEYENSWDKDSYIYEGIENLLKALAEKNIKIAVNTNKGHEMVTTMIERCFFNWKFDSIMGMKPHVEKKPSPEGAMAILSQLGVRPEECLYVGDSEVDLMTARNSKIPAIAVTWGFRSRETLEAHHPNGMIDHPMALLAYLR